MPSSFSLDPRTAIVIATLMMLLNGGVQDNPLQMAGRSIPLTVSIGLASYRGSDRDFNDLLRRADQALYKAKQNGRNRVEIAEAESSIDAPKQST